MFKIKEQISIMNKRLKIRDIILEALNAEQMESVKTAGKLSMQLREKVNILINDYLTDVVENGNEGAVQDAKNTINEIKEMLNSIENQLNF